jgi:hypothetical protein
MELLGDPDELHDRHFDAYGEVTNAFMIKNDPQHAGGIDMPKGTLYHWAKKFRFDLSEPPNQPFQPTPDGAAERRR